MVSKPGCGGQSRVGNAGALLRGGRQYFEESILIVGQARHVRRVVHGSQHILTAIDTRKSRDAYGNG